MRVLYRQIILFFPNALHLFGLQALNLVRTLRLTHGHRLVNWVHRLLFWSGTPRRDHWLRNLRALAISSIIFKRHNNDGLRLNEVVFAYLDLLEMCSTCDAKLALLIEVDEMQVTTKVLNVHHKEGLLDSLHNNIPLRRINLKLKSLRINTHLNTRKKLPQILRRRHPRLNFQKLIHHFFSIKQLVFADFILLN